MTQANGRLRYWANDLPPWFDGLTEGLDRSLGGIERLDLDPKPDEADGATVLLMLTGESAEGDHVLDWLGALDSRTKVNVIVVVYDGHLGSDNDRARAQLSGAAVACVRSLAVERGTSVRANVICLPETIVDSSTELRGPLPLPPTVDDLVESVRFLAGPDGDYLSGQVLYVDSGRHLFSSSTS